MANLSKIKDFFSKYFFLNTVILFKRKSVRIEPQDDVVM